MMTTTQKEDVVKSIEDMNTAIKKIDEESRVSFNEAFNTIKQNFLKNFKILFEGGEAELCLMEPDDVLETGLEIKAQPPGKRLLNLKLLSGGEKTLTSRNCQDLRVPAEPGVYLNEIISDSSVYLTFSASGYVASRCQ